MKKTLLASILAVTFLTSLTGCVTMQTQDQAYNYVRQPTQLNGRIENVRVVKSSTSGGGMVLGAVTGGLLGSTVGRGTGNTLATVAGVAAGGLVGNQIEGNSVREALEVGVRFDNGDRATVLIDVHSNVRVGERIKLYRQGDGRITTQP